MTLRWPAFLGVSVTLIGFGVAGAGLAKQVPQAQTGAATPPATHAGQPPAATASLAARLDRLLESPAASRAHWGVYVYSLDRQRVLYDHNGGQMFIPASNAKLPITSAALQLIGPDYRFHTSVTAAGGINPEGVLLGDLTLVGEGDPTLSGRSYPYTYLDKPPVPPYAPDAALERLADALTARGLRRVTGDIVGDDTYFAPPSIPRGWNANDLVYGYAAPASALTVNDNSRFIVVRPGAAPGAAAEAEFVAPSPLEAGPQQLQVAVRTIAAADGTSIALGSRPNAIRVSGEIAAGSRGDLELAAVPDPALYAAALLRQALFARGVTIDGAARARHAEAPAAASETAPGSSTGMTANPIPAVTPPVELAGLDSPPLWQILQFTDKESENLHAELMLLLLGKLKRGQGTREAGEAVVAGFLHDAGLDAHDFALVDGSGLSDDDLVTPAGIVRLLRYMNALPGAGQWRSFFPIAGQDGTLAHRFRQTDAAGRVVAKTGSIAHVNCLSGYAMTLSGEHLAFSILVDNDAGGRSETRDEIDRLVESLMP